MLLLGIDIGTSFIKVAVVDAETKSCIASVQYPEKEAEIISLQKGWAEQCPEMWWQYTMQAILKLNHTNEFDPKLISAIGIAYQMHGLVLVDKDQNILRNAIIWCDSRAVSNTAYGNFTASKLAWVKNNEPDIYNKIDQIMLPGDFIAMKLTHKVTVTPSGLSEGIFWDFDKKEISKEMLLHFGFEENIFPEIKDVFSNHGFLNNKVADELGLAAGIPVAYKAGDQLNNALSLNVMKPGEVAATAGTSGVIYAITDKPVADKINSFVHVNKSVGALLCINGCGIMNSWVKKMFESEYSQMNIQAMGVPVGSDGLMTYPFGNGAERMFDNKIIGAKFSGVDLNKHNKQHFYRAVQEGIAFAFRYGLDIMRENGINPKIIRAAKANMFLSDVFAEAFVNATGVPVELYKTNGSVGAAFGAGMGIGILTSMDHVTPIEKIEPTKIEVYNELYNNWKIKLNGIL